MKKRELPGIRERTSDFDGIEAQILKMFRQEIYLPLMRELRAPLKLLKNAVDPLERLSAALQSGRLRYERGRFLGKLDSGLSKALSAIGAKWDYKGFYTLPAAKLPQEIRSAIAVSENRFLRMTASIDKKLGQILPEQLAEKVKIAHYFDRTLYRIDQDFEAQVKAITVVPKLTAEAREKIAIGYTTDLQRYIKEFTEKEIARLRKNITRETIAGNRYEMLAGQITESYGVSERKAKFLARQETALMMSSFKQVRYQEAGIEQYRWQCVVGSPAHPVRPMHKALNGKVFSWNSPPVTDDKGARNHPGQDYNCRCVARPIVNF